MTALSSLSLQLSGYVPANRDAVVRLTNELTGAVHESKPFLDGSLQLKNLDPGPYQLQVVHPNLMTAIDNRRIRIFDQVAPTVVRIPVPAELFKDNPIRDVPDADLTPVQQLADRARASLAPITAKASGEVIRAQDWNTLAGAVSDLSSAVLELTRLVSPQGHDHPEIAEKIGEVQENLRRFTESFGRSLVELRREIESDNLRQRVTDLMDVGQASPAVREAMTSRLKDLDDSLQADSAVFTRKLSNFGGFVLNTVNDLAAADGAGAEALANHESVKSLTASAKSYLDAGAQIRPESELLTYKNSAAASGGKIFFSRGA